MNLLLQARPDTYIQCEIWDENKVGTLRICLDRLA